jgi:hypothetical protein
MFARVASAPRSSSLRVTQVYRRDGSNWQVVHRHADPLVHGIDLEQRRRSPAADRGRAAARAEAQVGGRSS